MATPEKQRLWSLVEAGIALSGEVDLDALLRKIVRIACRISGARYGALGVLKEDGREIERFVFHGISKKDAERIGKWPQGRGLLGALMTGTDPRPIRLESIREDRRSVGFPKHHPKMQTFLGVPVKTKSGVFGNLYLTEKRSGQPFSEEDERLVVALAGFAGIAIENARLLREAREKEAEARSRLEERLYVQEVGAALLGELDPVRVLRTIAHRARRLAKADTACVVMLEDEDTLVMKVVVGRGSRAVRGVRFPVAGSKSGSAIKTGKPAAVDDLYAEPKAYSPIVKALEARSGMFVPLFDSDKPVGVLAVTHRQPRRFGDRELDILTSFANLGSLALRNARLIASERWRAEAEAELAEVRAKEAMRGELLRRVILAQEEERRRVSRDLHDSVGQALAAILLGLKVVEQQPTL